MAQLFPLISSVKELSWENLVESHQRWSEEVIAICSLAGNGVYAALDSNAAYGRILDATFNDEIQNDGLYPYENGIGGTTAAPAASVTGSAPTVTAKSTPATDHDTVTDKGRQSTSTAGILSNKLFGGGSADKASPSRTTTMKKKTESKDKDNAKKRPIYTEQDDRIARAIIVLTMKRDLRQRFAKLMKAAVTARQLFNGLAIMKEAVSALTFVFSFLYSTYMLVKG